MALNLEKQLQFYGAYHHNVVNIGIHVVFVPLILFTALMFATNTPDLQLPEWLTIPYLPCNLGTVAAFLYAILYILMEPVAGGLFAPLIIAGVAYGNYLTNTYGAQANWIGFYVHVTSWIAQFIGHGKFEGRAPALRDNLVQALFLAPLFVWMEVLFSLGYRPELKKRLDKAVEEEIAKFQGKSSNASSNGKGH